MPETVCLSLPLEHRCEELRFFLAPANLHLEVWRPQHPGEAAALTGRLTLPLTLWPRFREAVGCLGAFMKPLPAPAYQSMPCCPHTCPAAPGTVVLGQTGREQLLLSLEDRRGSTFLEIRGTNTAAAAPEPLAIRLGPTHWSAFLSVLERLQQIMITPCLIAEDPNPAP